MIYRNQFILSVFILFCSSYLQAMNTFNDKKINSDYLSLSQLNELNEKNRIIISFGESLSREALSIARINEYSWEINGGDFNESGKGEGLLKFVFQNPGQYTISLTPTNVVHDIHEGSCNHGAESKQFEIIVLSIKLEFLFEQSTFSVPIKGGVDVSGTVMSIPVVFSSYDNKDTQIEGLKIITSGVNTTIHGVLKNQEVALSQGQNTINIGLHGVASPDTYIMFDFYYYDDLIATYYCPNKINK
jgi:hypothetical protein